MGTPSPRSPQEAEALLAQEATRLAPRREELGEAGVFAVAGWTLQMHLEWEAAELAWGRAAELDPASAEALLGMGICALETGRFLEAAECIRRAIVLDAETSADPDAPSLEWFDEDPAYKLGTALHAAGELAAAVEAYEQSARRNTLGVAALFEAAKCHLACERPAEALEALGRLAPRAKKPGTRADLMALRADAENMLRSRTS